MRYYDLQIISKDDGRILNRWSSLYLNGAQKGSFNPGSQNIEIDVTAFNYATPLGSSSVRVWGVGLNDIGQAANYNGQLFLLSAGMSAGGYQLANPNQAGVILKGQVFQAIGNYQAAVLTLDFFVIFGQLVSPLNLVLNWTKGTELSVAIEQALRTAYPSGTNINVNISQNIRATETQNVPALSLTAFATKCYEYSKRVIKDDKYIGVQISPSADMTTINVYDGTVITPIKTLQYNDLIGQPAWLTFSTISFKTVLRADLSVNTYIKMPEAAFKQTAASYPAFKQTSLMQNKFLITQLRQAGNYRQPDGNSWCTIFNAVQIQE